MADDDLPKGRGRPRNFGRPSSALGRNDPSPQPPVVQPQPQQQSQQQHWQPPPQPRPTPPPPVTMQTTSIIGQSERAGSSRPVTTQPYATPYGVTSSTSIFKPGFPEHLQQTAPSQTTSIIGQSHRGGTNRPVTTSQGPNVKFTSAHADKVVELVANYVKVNHEDSTIFYQYHVDFEPKMENPQTRCRLIAAGGHFFHQVYIYDKQSTLMSVTDLGNQKVVYSESLRPGVSVKVTLKQTRLISIDDEQMMHLLNTQLRSNMEKMGLVQILRHHYDMDLLTPIEDQRMQIIPGIVNSIKNCQAGLLMSVDTIHKVLHLKTVLDMIKEMKEGSSFEREFIGAVVLTRYNNRTYRICGIDRQKTPNSFFTPGAKFREDAPNNITYIDYYRETYTIDIEDANQPLLIATASNFEKKQKSHKVNLIPELCFITGLTPGMQTNFNLKRLLVTKTQLTPRDRVNRYNAFLTKINTTPRVQEELRPWNVDYDKELLRVKGRTLASERVLVNGQTQRPATEVSFVQRAADFTREIKNKPMYRSCTMTNWHVVAIPRDLEQDLINFFIQTHARTLARELGIRYAEPSIRPTRGESSANFLEVITQIGEDSDMIMVVLPNAGKFTYDDVKRYLCCEVGVPSQCVLAKTLFRKNMSISSKIMIQVACKVGAEPWVLNMDKLPEGLMIIGFDVYRDKNKRKKSVGGFVASLNKTFSSWFNKINFHKTIEESSEHMVTNLSAALRAYKRRNDGRPPQNILIIRDGISEGQYKLIIETELRDLQVRAHEENPNIKITFICLSKRINTRFFKITDGSYFENPVSGTVVDSDIVSAEYPQFFLVSQLTNQGTVSPTSYTILDDGMRWEIVEYQRLMYQLCHLYYNWTGLVSVPAPIQYAHKLAYLAGGSFGEMNFNEEKLSEKLFYL